MAEAVEEGIRVVVFREKEQQRIELAVHIKALRWLKANAETVSRGDKETVLFQVKQWTCTQASAQTYLWNVTVSSLSHLL